MEQGEPALVPQWYKIANGNTSTNGLRTNSSKRFDENSVGHSPRNRLLGNHDRNIRRSLSSNESVEKGSSGRSQAYSNFRRSRDRYQDRDFDSRDRENKSLSFDNGFDYHDSVLGVRSEEHALRRSQSLIAERQAESRAKKLGSSGNNSSPSRGSIIGNIGKTSFEKEFPSLRVDAKQSFYDASTVSPLGLRTAVQSLPAITPVIIGTSALAEVPAKVETDGSIHSPVLPTSTVNQASTPGSSMPGLNMAEALTQVPSQVSDVPQLLINTQRIEELNLRKCKQLIPMTPSLPKSLNGSLSDKTKSKVARAGDFNSLSKVAQQSHVNQTIRSSTNSDAAKISSVGTFQVLNREKNDIISVAKDGQGVSKSVNVVAPFPSAVLPSKIPTDQNLNIDKNAGDRKILSQAQNRNAFFNLLRKKSSSGSTSVSKPSSVEPALITEKSNAEHQHCTSPVNNKLNNSFPSESDLNGSTEVGSMSEDFCTSNLSERSYSDNGETNPDSDIVVDPEEEAFLRSLGWDKNGWEEALTAEEIDDFHKKYEKQRPLKIVPEYSSGADA
ncbi:uncharacterized protein LOC121982362 [Zingiber officinale]|uniref:Uncharacterized protein n=1 Tax=Zingiber officinale TaxID=94328 RepID=A0A8J5L7T1_ZINOF|nr:uncharacterized protein LOC121982362 [Zingiber officinale]XP_042391316.1 uncharacterized protein LOC121982362 [Zingiber officinale]KAG6509063.1 hypothetical protein ZIOFF_034454 [Zingiber officinale]